MNRRRLALLITVLVLLPAVTYLGAGVVIYNTLTTTYAKCNGKFAEQTPATFVVNTVDTTPYLMKTYESVEFPSRDPNITISGWYVPSTQPDAPAVIVQHGLKSCKREGIVLLAAGMLARNGFSVLLMDLRDHGDSTVEDDRFAGGTEEYRDVLGGWDWLVNTKKIPPARIGLYGQSLGAATVTIEMGEEPRVAATWEDSSFADILVAIEAELKRNNYPTFFAPAGILVGKLVAGDDLASLSPLKAVGKLNGRPFFITHGTADTRLSVEYASDLANAIRASGGKVEPWIVEGSEHVLAVRDHPADYEAKMVAFFKDALTKG